MKTDQKYSRIDFLILAAKLSSELQATESFILQEMAYGQYDYSPSAQEAAVMWASVSSKLFDVISSSLLVEEGSTFGEQESIKLSARMNSVISKSMIRFKKNKNIDQAFSDLWCASHSYVYDLIKTIVRRVVGVEKRDVLSKLATILSDSVDATRFELYEIDNLLFRKKNILMVTDMCIAGMDAMGDNPLVVKYKIYSSHTEQKERFKMRNYCSSFSAYKICIQDLRDSGAHIDSREAARSEDE